MAKGLRTKSERFIQMIRQSDPSVFDAAGVRNILANVEDYSYTPGNTYDSVKRRGSNAKSFNALTEAIRTGDLNGAIYYNTVDDTLFPFVYAEVASGADTTTGGVRTRIYDFAQIGRCDRPFFAIEEGSPTRAVRGLAGHFNSFKFTSKRGNNGQSRFSAGFTTTNAPEVGAMTGGVAANAVLTFTASAVTGDGVFAITKAGSAAQNVTFSINDTTAQTVTKFATAGLTVAVAGTVVAPAAKVNASTSGSGALYSAGSTTNAGNAFDSNTATVATVPASGYLGWTFTTAMTINAIRVTRDTDAPIGLSFNATVTASANGTFSDEVTLLTTTALVSNTVVTFANTTAYKAYRLRNTEGAQITVKELEFMVDNTATTNGTIVVTVSNPSNTAVTIAPVSGTGWSGLVTQMGNNGVLRSVLKAPLPLLPQHLSFYVADTYAGLDQASAYVGTVEEFEIDIPKIREARMPHNGQLSYTEVVDSEDVDIKLMVLLFADQGSSTRCQDMVNNAEAYISKPLYWRVKAALPGTLYQIIFEFYGSVGSTVEYEYNGNAEERRFNFDLIENLDLEWNFRVTTKVPA